MRKTLALLLSLIFVFAACGNAFAGTVAEPGRAVYSGACGANLTWTLDTETGVLTISGTGAMTDRTAPWYSYTESIKTVRIGSGVTSIGEGAFCDCYSLTSVTIPDSVTSIGNSAFFKCYSLGGVIIPDSVTSIGYRAFQYCSSLTSVTIPDEVTSIGYSAFEGCSSLTSVTIPDGVTSIGNYAFQYCSSLTSVTIPDSVTSIGWNAFSGCSSLTSVTIGNGVTSIGAGAFGNCSSLTSISVDVDNHAYSSLDGVLFNKDISILICCPGGKTGAYIIPDGVTSIGDYAFSGCSSLTSVTIPDSVTSIGESAFEYCSSLTSMTIPDSVTSIGACAFSDCTSLISVNIPDGVTCIHACTFQDCRSLISVNIPSSVNVIENDAFCGCRSLTSVTIPDSVTSIVCNAFEGCSSLTSVTIGNGVTSIDNLAFSMCGSLTSISVSADNQTYSSLDGVLFNKDRSMLLCCPGGKTGTYIIPNSVTSIGNIAFFYCRKLTSVTIPDSVTSIDYEAFVGCSSLTSVTVGNGVTGIGDAAFNLCSSLTSAVFLGAPPSSFGSYLFNGCASDFCIYYTAAHASEWAPNGETTWNGYPIALASFATVTFTGVYNDTIEVLCGSDVTLPVFPGEGVHYTFTVNGEPWDGTNITEDVTVEVGLDINVYAVTFIDSMTGEILSEQQVRYGEAAIAPEPPEYLAYEFIGWDTDFSNVKSDLVINAEYEKVAFIVTFYDPMDDSVIETQAVYPGEAAIPPAPPEHYGYNFTEWQGDFSCVTEDMTVSAVYAPKKFVVKFTDGKGNIIDTQLVAYLTAATEPEPPYAEPGEIFIGWDADFSCITGDTVINAVWEYVTVCTVTFTGAYTGTVVVNYGEDCELPVYPSQYLHYTFMVDGEYWDGECVTSDVTVVVSAAANSIDCTVVFVDWDGTVLSTQTVRYGSPATPPEDPTREGCVFIGWNKNVEFIAHDVTIRAKYAKDANYRPGDVDCDGLVTMTDISVFFNYLNGGNVQISVQGLLNADANDEWNVDIRDVTAIFTVIANS